MRSGYNAHMPTLFTRRGDDGQTGLLGEGRVSKDDMRIEACGAADSASSALALARALAGSEVVRAAVLSVQDDLYRLMAELAALPETAERFRAIDAGRVSWLEEQIAAFEARVTVPQGFVVPGDTAGGAAMDLARTAVRAAERRVVALREARGLANPHLLAYLNRLSSLCFVMALHEDQHGGAPRPRLAGRTQT